MSKKVNERIPVNSGDGAGFKKYNAVQTPWNKLFSYQESLHYASRFESVLSPPWRSTASSSRLRTAPRRWRRPHAPVLAPCTWPTGRSIILHAACTMPIGDKGDDALDVRPLPRLRHLRQNELTSRLGHLLPELCRATTMSPRKAEATATRHRPGKSMDYMMVRPRAAATATAASPKPREASRPEHALGVLGPAVSDDYKVHRGGLRRGVDDVPRETDYLVNGTNEETDSSTRRQPHRGVLYLLPAIDNAVRKGYDPRERRLHLKVSRGAASMFGERYAIAPAASGSACPTDCEDGI